MPLPKILASLVAIGALAFALCARGGFNHWTFSGPAAGGAAISVVTAHPSDPNIALTGTPRGIFRTANKGATWTLVKNDVTAAPAAIVFDPTNPTRVVATDGELYLSNDTGQSFSALARPATTTSARRIAFAANGTLYLLADAGRIFKAAAPFTTWTELTMGWTDGSPQFITPHPTDPQVLYVGIYGRGIFRSENGGTSWSLLTAGFANPTVIGYYGIAIDPADSRRLFAATTYGVHLSTDTGASWSLIRGQLAEWIGINPANPSSVFVCGFYGIFRGDISGSGAWGQLQLLNMASVPNISFIAGGPQEAYVATGNGLFYTDEANTWFSFQFKDVGITGVSPSNLAATHDTVYATMPVEWSELHRRVGSNYVATHDFFDQLQVHYPRDVRSLAVAPNDSSQLYAINAWRELFHSTDGGKHWSGPHPTFLPTDPNPDFLNDVTIDPRDPQVAYVARKYTGLWKTTNGGATFDPLPNSPSNVQEIGISPHDSQVLYVVTGNGNNRTGISKSIDGGDSWVEQMAPLNNSNRYFTRFAFHPTDPGIVYLPASYDGLYRTSNGGGAWDRVSLPQPAGPLWWAETVLIDPVKPSTVWVLNGLQASFWRSVNNGATWDTTAMPNVPGQAVSLWQGVFDPDDPTIILAASAGAGVADYQVMPDLKVTLVSEPQTPLAVATTVNAIFRVSNVGVHSASSADLEVDVPAWLTPSATGCTFTAPRLHCPLGAVLVGANRDISVTLVVGPTPQASASVVGRVSGYEQDIDLTNNQYGFTSAAQERANLAVAISASANAFDRGSTTNVTVTASNSGPSPSTGTQLTLSLPGNVSATQVTNPRGSCTTSASTVTCSLGTLAVNANAAVTVQLRGDSAGTGTLTAEVAGAGVDPDGLHSATRDLTVRPVSDLAVAIDESGDPITVGDAYWYYVRVRNNGTDPVPFHLGVVINNATPDAASPDVAATCTVTGGNVACDSAGLAGGATATITIRTAGSLAGIATITATVTSDATDTNAANNSAATGTTLRLVGDVSAQVVVSQGPVSAVGQFNYTATVRNMGPSTGAVQVVIPLTNATVVAVIPGAAACTHTATSVTCDVASLGMGGSAAITITATGIAAGPSSATATATFIGVDPNPANDSATVQTDVPDVGDLAVELSENADPVVAGGTLAYTAAVRNLGPINGVAHLAIALTGGTVRSVTPPGAATCTNTTTAVSCDLPVVASAAAATFTIEVNTTAAGTASASATVSFAGTDPVSTNNTASVTTTINAAPSSSSSSGGGSSSSGGGGGGGRFDWLVLAALGVISLGRAALRRPV